MHKYRLYWRVALAGRDPEPQWLNNAATVPAADQAQAEAALIERVKRDHPDATTITITRTERVQE